MSAYADGPFRVVYEAEARNMTHGTCSTLAFYNQCQRDVDAAMARCRRETPTVPLREDDR